MTFQTRNDDDDDDDDDVHAEPEGYKTSVRRPNVPGIYIEREMFYLTTHSTHFFAHIY